LDRFTLQNILIRQVRLLDKVVRLQISSALVNVNVNRVKLYLTI
jgi:hypothetical protein